MKNIILILTICGILSGCTKNDAESAESASSERYISFQDYTVKEICINMWDTNGDGQLSEKEAASVKSIGNVFTDKKIFQFDEFEYFTGITEIPAKAFYYEEKKSGQLIGSSIYYWTEMFLKSITIPKNVCKIGSQAFSMDNGAKITFKPFIPPYVNSFVVINGSISYDGFTIYVPSSAYLTDSNSSWSYYRDIIKINESL